MYTYFRIQNILERNILLDILVRTDKFTNYFIGK